MVRATTVAMLKLWLGTYPAGIDATSAGNVIAQASAWLDSYTYPTKLSSTDAGAILAENMLACNMCMHGLWYHAGGEMTGKPEPVVLTPQLKEFIDRLLIDTTWDGADGGEMIADD
ncbi:MAG: hypothetical protein ACXACE_15865 [Candidatus Thorarchaeota archaeon]